MYVICIKDRKKRKGKGKGKRKKKEKKEKKKEKKEKKKGKKEERKKVGSFRFFFKTFHIFPNPNWYFCRPPRKRWPNFFYPGR